MVLQLQMSSVDKLITMGRASLTHLSLTSLPSPGLWAEVGRREN